jgi:hypothetical protein
MEILVVIFILMFLALFIIGTVNTYKSIKSHNSLDELYKYSDYLVCKIEDNPKLKNGKLYNELKDYIYKKEGIFFVLHTNSKIVKTEKVKFLKREEFNTFFKKLKNNLINKELKFSFFNLENAIQKDISFFWLLVNYKNLAFIKYITIKNLTFLFVFLITTILVLFTIITQKTLLLLGIPLQLNLVNTFELAQFISYNTLGNTIIPFLLTLSFLILIVWILSEIIIFIKNRKDKLRNPFLVIDEYFKYSLIGLLSFILFIFLTIISFSITSILKMDYQNSIIRYDTVLTFVYEYRNYTGYPRVANINGDFSYIAGYDDNNLYYYNFDEINDKFFTFKDKKLNQNLLDTCELLPKYKDKSVRLIILLLKNEYLKPKYIRRISNNAILTNERPLDYKDIIIDDIDKKCVIYIKNTKKE